VSEFAVAEPSGLDDGDCAGGTGGAGDIVAADAPSMTTCRRSPSPPAGSWRGYPPARKARARCWPPRSFTPPSRASDRTGDVVRTRPSQGSSSFAAAPRVGSPQDRSCGASLSSLLLHAAAHFLFCWPPKIGGRVDRPGLTEIHVCNPWACRWSKTWKSHRD
jgi:hypothetical protein